MKNPSCELFPSITGVSGCHGRIWPAPPRKPSPCSRRRSPTRPARSPSETSFVGGSSPSRIHRTFRLAAPLVAAAVGTPPSRALPPASFQDQARPIAVRRPPIPARQGEERSGAAAGFWLESDTAAEESREDAVASPDVFENLTELETPAPLPAHPVVLPRPGREQVAQAVLDALLRDMPRVLVFGADKNHLFGVSRRAEGVLSSAVQRIPLAPPHRYI